MVRRARLRRPVYFLRPGRKERRSGVALQGKPGRKSVLVVCQYDKRRQDRGDVLVVEYNGSLFVMSIAVVTSLDVQATASQKQLELLDSALTDRERYGSVFISD